MRAPSPGRPAFLDKLTAFRQAHGLDDHIVCVGRQDAVERYLKAADIFVFPSRREGFPTAVIEAMSCGLPVVIWHMNGVAQDIVTPGMDGFIVNDLNPSAFAEVISLLLDDPSMQAEVGQNARRTVCQRFSIKRMVSDYVALMHNLVKGTEC